jgi:hypothetical protein
MKTTEKSNSCKCKTIETESLKKANKVDTQNRHSKQQQIEFYAFRCATKLQE